MSNDQLAEKSRPRNGDALIDALPDLVVLVRRDGVILDHGGGQRLAGLKLNRESIGVRLEQLWPETVAELLMHLTRGAISIRASTEAKFEVNGLHYEARLTAHGPDRALCVIRPVLETSDALDATGERLRPQLDRRGFLRRFKEVVSLATLCEKAAAVAVIHLDGVADIAQSIDAKLAEEPERSRHGRGHRDLRPIGVAARARLRRGAGLPAIQAAVGGGLGGALSASGGHGLRAGCAAIVSSMRPAGSMMRCKTRAKK